MSEEDFRKALLRMNKEERVWWQRRGREAWNSFVLEREREKKELQVWVTHKNKLIKGKNCVECGKPAQTMHHPKPRSEYSSFEEYLNEPNLKPVCHWCHYTVFHSGNPYHMLWKKCEYRNNPEICSLPEYRQKQVVFKTLCNQCKRKDKCLSVPIVTF